MTDIISLSHHDIAWWGRFRLVIVSSTSIGDFYLFVTVCSSLEVGVCVRELVEESMVVSGENNFDGLFFLKLSSNSLRDFSCLFA